MFFVAINIPPSEKHPLQKWVDVPKMDDARLCACFIMRYHAIRAWWKRHHLYDTYMRWESGYCVVHAVTVPMMGRLFLLVRRHTTPCTGPRRMGYCGAQYHKETASHTKSNNSGSFRRCIQLAFRLRRHCWCYKSSCHRLRPLQRMCNYPSTVLERALRCMRNPNMFHSSNTTHTVLVAHICTVNNVSWTNEWRALLIVYLAQWDTHSLGLPYTNPRVTQMCTLARAQHKYQTSTQRPRKSSTESVSTIRGTEEIKGTRNALLCSCEQ